MGLQHRCSKRNISSSLCTIQHYTAHTAFINKHACCEKWEKLFGESQSALFIPEVGEARPVGHLWSTGLRSSLDISGKCLWYAVAADQTNFLTTQTYFWCILQTPIPTKSSFKKWTHLILCVEHVGMHLYIEADVQATILVNQLLRNETGFTAYCCLQEWKFTSRVDGSDN